MTSIRAFDAYRGRRVLVTGHTGFKGAWLSLWLAELGATVIGVSDAVPTDPSLFSVAGVGARVRDHRADIRDGAAIRDLVLREQPEIIFHLAAQPLVRRALADPYETVTTNVIGTLTVLEAARAVPGVDGVVVITSDKVYRDRPIGPPYTEADALGGHEPYGASKAAAEIIAEVYTHASFHRGAGSANMPRVVTARAGNVIGGGDWAANRLVPDVVRAVLAGEDVTLRYPRAVRPWQHVLEPLGGYLTLGLGLLGGTPLPSCVNFGPADHRALPVVDLVSLFLSAWGPCETRVLVEEDRTGVEAALLQVNSCLAQTALGWQALWDAPRAVAESARWYRSWAAGDDMAQVTRSQISRYTQASAERNMLAHTAA
ncbi:CDP-glucose 4,6-dehydratase [Methylobacterium planeticum]|uniref:CDP-glucose 4,6-dehydratase n=1 Tax=Methylobacterium planeticum TaxID=2615211 RepID=A0A6N6MFJ5_9HYPH|nr:CDP-glucose 4,6-dehydratase [Methylobacterium planeticum]KAB1069584.1 CDP-glucose 4,6-dehydratase [Methylobacterium planeticum]